MQFCKDIQPGNARTKDCLEDHREELSSSCKDEVDAMVERRVRDFRLDSRLRTACENEIFNMCAYFGVSHQVAHWPPPRLSGEVVTNWGRVPRACPCQQ